MFNNCEPVWVVGATPNDGEMQSHLLGERPGFSLVGSRELKNDVPPSAFVAGDSAGDAKAMVAKVMSS
jgi:hypothetical protein